VKVFFADACMTDEPKLRANTTVGVRYFVFFPGVL